MNLCSGVFVSVAFFIDAQNALFLEELISLIDKP